MKVLIIGGTGNISTGITRYLLERGDKVVLYNRGNEKIQGTRSIIGDRIDYGNFKNQMQREEFDCVIDMICYEPEDAKSVVETFNDRIKQLIFCSTVDVYKKPAKNYPIHENDEKNPSPNFPYAYKKAQCELIFEEAHKRGDFGVTILRPAATYNDSWCPISLLGPGTTFLKRIREGKPIIALGDGTSVWVSSHRDDVSRAFANATLNEKTFGKSYNITGDETMTWEAYYSTVAKVMGARNIDFTYIPTDLLYRIAPRSAEWCEINFKYNNIFDNSLAKKELGYEYRINWEEGVRRMVNYHDKYGNINNAPEYPFYDEIVTKFRQVSEKLASELSFLDE